MNTPKLKIRKKNLQQMYGLLQGGSNPSSGGVSPPNIPSFISTSHLEYATRTNSTIPLPTDIEDGDNIYLIYDIGGTPPPSHTASGFDLISGFPISRADGFTVNTYLYNKVANAESGNYLITHASASTSGTIIVVRGGELYLDTLTDNSGNGSPATLTGFTVPDNSLIIYYCGGWETTMQNITEPNNVDLTLRNPLPGSVQWVGTGEHSGNTDTFSATGGAELFRWASFAIAIIPA